MRSFIIGLPPPPRGYLANKMGLLLPMSYDFSAGSRYITGTFSSTYDTPLSLVAWIKADAASWAQTSKDWVAMMTDGTADEAWTISKTQGAADRVTASARDGASENNAIEGSVDGTYDDTWVMIAGVFTNDSLRDIYIENSTETGTATGTRNPQLADEIWIGAGVSGFSNFDGLIAEVAVFDVALTTAMIDDLQTGAEAGIPPNEVDSANCIGYWSLDTDQSTHADESGNSGPTLTVTGAVFDADHPTITPTAAPIVIPVPAGPEF